MISRASVNLRIHQITAAIRDSAVTEQYLIDLIKSLAKLKLPTNYFDDVAYAHNLLPLLIEKELLHAAEKFIELFDSYESLLFNKDDTGLTALWLAINVPNPQLKLHAQRLTKALLLRLMRTDNDKYINYLLEEASEGTSAKAIHLLAYDELYILLLLAKGAKLHALDNDHNTILHYACTLNNLNLILTLLQMGADVGFANKHNVTPMQLILNLPNPDIQKIFVSLNLEQRKAFLDACYPALSATPNHDIEKDLLYYKLISLGSLKQYVFELYFYQQILPSPTKRFAFEDVANFDKNRRFRLMQPLPKEQLAKCESDVLRFSDNHFNDIINALQRNINFLNNLNKTDYSYAIKKTLILSLLTLIFVGATTVFFVQVAHFDNLAQKIEDDLDNHWGEYNQSQYQMLERQQDHYNSLSGKFIGGGIGGLIMSLLVGIYFLVISCSIWSREASIERLAIKLFDLHVNEILNELGKLERSNSELPITVAEIRSLESSMQSLQSLPRITDAINSGNAIISKVTALKQACLKKEFLFFRQPVEQRIQIAPVIEVKVQAEADEHTYLLRNHQG